MSGHPPTKIDVDAVEKLFFVAGLVSLLIVLLLKVLLPPCDAQGCRAEALRQLDVGVMCAGLVFAVINFRSWKLFIVLSSYPDSARGRRIKFGAVLLLKAAAVTAFVSILVAANAQQVLSFLLILSAYLVLGALFTGLAVFLR